MCVHGPVEIGRPNCFARYLQLTVMGTMSCLLYTSTMSLRSKNLKIDRLSGNECVIFEPRTATGRRRMSNKVRFAPPHRRLQDSMVKNQNDQRTMRLRSKNLKIGR